MKLYFAFASMASASMGLLLAWCAEGVHMAYYGEPGIIGWLIRITMGAASLFFAVAIFVRQS